MATSGKTHHPIVQTSANPADEVAGTVFEITDQELVVDRISGGSAPDKMKLSAIDGPSQRQDDDANSCLQSSVLDTAASARARCSIPRVGRDYGFFRRNAVN